MNRYLLLLVIMSALFFGQACKENRPVLYESDKYTLYSDGVSQGRYKAKVISREEMVSDYQSPSSQHYPAEIVFKLSINEKDNENRPGDDHRVVISKGQHSHLVVFGEIDNAVSDDQSWDLPQDYQFTFRVDMNNVFKEFEEKGYYETYDGTPVYLKDFKGLYIAGASDPLSWDFDNLEEKGLELEDEDNDRIYEIELKLNPTYSKAGNKGSWRLKQDITEKPVYKSDQPLVDALFNMALEEGLMNIEPDSTFRTGAEWGGVWTRDVSYSIFLAFALNEPEVAEISLMRKVQRGRIIQDTGSGGAWPVSSDRAVWAIAAWELYCVSGDNQWLEKSYNIIKNSLDDDMLTLVSYQTGMNKGESSFLDWREQTYPRWMENADIFMSENLGTNVVHYRAYTILAEMASILGEPNELYLRRASEIKDGINKYLWIDEKAMYGQYLYGRSSMILSPRFETLGESLAVLFGVADNEQAKKLVAGAPLTPYGISCIYPQIPGIPPYHNNAVWPFVQAYWNLAAAKAGNGDVLEHGLASIYRPAALYLTNYENFVAGTGDYEGTEINSSRMLWSMAGNMAMVYRLFTGLNFTPEGINFTPVIPEAYSGRRELSNLHYRNSTLNIEVSGHGNIIEYVKMDGELLDSAFIPSSITGEHNISIKMQNNSLAGMGRSIVENKFSLPSPKAGLADNSLVWNKIEGASEYTVYCNGEKYVSTTDTCIDISSDGLQEFMITATDREDLESFSCEPLEYYPSGDLIIAEAEDYSGKSLFESTGYSGDGFTRISTEENRNLVLKIWAGKEGLYKLSARYANGTGPWNTDNNCGIRSIYLDNAYRGVMVFPQRGEGEWSDWGFTNIMKVPLQKGYNKLEIRFDEWNINMDGQINEALIDYFVLTRCL